LLEEVVKMETSKGSPAFDEETPAKRDKRKGEESPKRKRKTTTAEPPKETLGGSRSAGGGGDRRSDVILEGSLGVFVLPRPLFVFLV
jgi:hypothetical protein